MRPSRPKQTGERVMTPEGLRKKIERETGLFLRLQTHKFKDSGPFSDWVYEGYLTVSTEQQILKGINGHKDRKRPAGISKDFSVHDHPSADEARLDVLGYAERLTPEKMKALLAIDAAYISVDYNS